MFPAATSAVEEQKCKASLLELPVELLIGIYCHLASNAETFPAVLALAATSRRAREVCNLNITAVYQHVVPRVIPCERHARRLLADQGGAAADSPKIYPKDVHRMLRNSGVVEIAVKYFEEHILRLNIRRVRYRSLFTPLDGPNGYVINDAECAKYYGYGMKEHPLHLTQTERLRFISTYYHFWRLYRVAREDWTSRLKSLTPRRILYLDGLCDIAIGEGSKAYCQRSFCPPRKSMSPPHDYHASDVNYIIARELREHVSPFVEMLHKSVQGHEPSPVLHSASKAEWGSVVFLDHWQPNVENCLRGVKAMDPSKSPVSQFAGDDSSDEGY